MVASATTRRTVSKMEKFKGRRRTRAAEAIETRRRKKGVSRREEISPVSEKSARKRIGDRRNTNDDKESRTKCRKTSYLLPFPVEATNRKVTSTSNRKKPSRMHLYHLHSPRIRHDRFILPPSLPYDDLKKRKVERRGHVIKRCACERCPFTT